jgi:hypothetical protein
LTTLTAANLNQWVTMIRDLMIGGASVDDTLTLWASSLRDVKQRIRGRGSGTAYGAIVVPNARRRRHVGGFLFG